MKRINLILMFFAVARWGMLFIDCKVEASDTSDNILTPTNNDYTITNSESPPDSEQQESELPGDEPAIPRGVVVFDNVGISLNLGLEWQMRTNGPFTEWQALCLPVLVGLGKNSASLIQVFSTAGKVDALTAADTMKTKVESEPNTVKATFKQDAFSCISGVNGVRVFYEYKSNRPSSTKTLRAHIYLFQNAKKDCIAIHYITFVDKDSARVDQMILDTLTLN